MWGGKTPVTRQITGREEQKGEFWQIWRPNAKKRKLEGEVKSMAAKRGGEGD